MGWSGARGVEKHITQGKDVALGDRFWQGCTLRLNRMTSSFSGGLRTEYCSFRMNTTTTLYILKRHETSSRFTFRACKVAPALQQQQQQHHHPYIRGSLRRNKNT